jgi:adenine/guanine phosphoribosyltransferase-like PRPP-binding protein
MFIVASAVIIGCVLPCGMRPFLFLRKKEKTCWHTYAHTARTYDQQAINKIICGAL